MTAAITVGLLFAGGVFLLLSRGIVRIVVGFVLLGHGVNVLLLAAGGMDRRAAPLDGSDPAESADPLPQAFVLTAIVITFGVTVYLLGLARAGRSDADRAGSEDDRAGSEPDRRGADGDRGRSGRGSS
jgi:multicomponent Na+:H+ antiporter subunit C